MITGITHAAIRVTDLARSMKFYSEVLGFPEQFSLTRENGDPWLVYLKISDNQFIELFPGAEGPFARPDTSAFVHICLQVDDIDATYKELTSRGMVATREPKLGGDGSWQFWTEDPDGNPIEFHQFTPQSRQITG